MISLRLSEREFETLKSLYAAHGARNVSDFIRSILQRVTEPEMQRESRNLQVKVQEMDGRLSVLDGEVTRLTQLLERIYADKS